MSRAPALLTRATTDWATAAEATVRAYCGWHVAPAFREILTLSALHRSRDLWIPSGHVVEIHSVEIREPAGSWRTLDEHKIEWDETGLVRLSRGAAWPETLRGVRVDLTHGYDADEVPDVLALMTNLAKRAATGAYGLASQSVNGAAVTYQTAGGAPLSIPLLQIEKQALAPYVLATGRIAG